MTNDNAEDAGSTFAEYVLVNHRKWADIVAAIAMVADRSVTKASEMWGALEFPDYEEVSIESVEYVGPKPELQGMHAFRVTVPGTGDPRIVERFDEDAPRSVNFFVGLIKLLHWAVHESNKEEFLYAGALISYFELMYLDLDHNSMEEDSDE